MVGFPCKWTFMCKLIRVLKKSSQNLWRPEHIFIKSWSKDTWKILFRNTNSGSFLNRDASQCWFFNTWPSAFVSCFVLCCRSAQLPGLQPPAVAPAAGAHVLLVAPVVGLHHGVQTQPSLSRSPPSLLELSSAGRDLCFCETVSSTDPLHVLEPDFSGLVVCDLDVFIT